MGYSLKNEYGKEGSNVSYDSSFTPIVQSLSPQHAGLKLSLPAGDTLFVGRDEKCGIRFAEGTPGISRRHCAISWDAGKACFMVVDTGSSYGTYLSNGTKLEPGMPYYLQPGSMFYLADSSNPIQLGIETLANTQPTATQYNQYAPPETFGQQLNSIPDIAPDPVSIGIPEENPPLIPDPDIVTPYKDTKKMKKSGKGKIIALAAVIAVILMIPAYCLVGHLIGNSKLKNGDYVAAYNTYKYDFLFSKKARIDAALQAGEHFYAVQDYDNAAVYFLAAGEAGEGRYHDTLSVHAIQMVNNGDPRGALALLSEFSAEAWAKEAVDLANLEIAKELLEAKKYAEAASYFEKCTDDSKAQNDAKILRLIDGKDYYTAAEAVLSATDADQSYLPLSKWKTVLSEVFGPADSLDVDHRLAKEAVLSILNRKSLSSEQWMTAITDAFTSKESMVGALSSSSDGYTDLALFQACGGDPQGKILLVMKTVDYPNKDETQVILFDLMENLPTQYYPRSLKEVEYLVIISYDFVNDGTYDKDTVGLREYAQVQVYRLPGEQSVYNSGTVYGAHSPDSFLYTGLPPVWKSGGVPNIIDKFYDALTAAMQ